jgi:hypothetical protein
VPFFDRIADMPGVPADAQAVAYARSVSAGASGVLRIEPHQVDAAIGIFEDAVDKLKRRVARANVEIKASPMAEDHVSQPAADAFNRASFDGPGAAVAAWTGAVNELESIIRQLRASKEAIFQAEDTVSQSFSSANGAMG